MLPDDQNLLAFNPPPCVGTAESARQYRKAASCLVVFAVERAGLIVTMIVENPEYARHLLRAFLFT